MRRVLIIPTLLLTCCSSEPDFDERYANAEQEIQERAAKIDAELSPETKPEKAAETPQH